MGVIRKQSLWVAVASYVGGALGFINKVVLFTRILSVQEVGFVNMLLEISALFGQLAVLGLGNSTLKYFPYFENKENGHNGLLPFLLTVVLAGTLLSIGGVYLLKPLIISWKQGNSLLASYYIYLIPMVFAYALFLILSTYLRSLYKLAIPALIKELGLRLGTTLVVSAFAFQWIDFDTFVLFISLIPALLAIMIIAYAISIGEFHIRPQTTDLIKKYAADILKHGPYVMLGGLSFLLVLKLDAFMVFSWLGEASTGVYLTMVYFTVVMEYPFRALSNTASPKIAEMWKENDVAGIRRFFKRISTMNLIVGLLLFFGIWINLDTVFWIMKDPAYATGRNVFLILGLARVAHMLLGFNQIILITSRAFRYDLIFNIILLLSAFYLNYLLIPKYGIEGAAIATAISMVAYNLIRVVFIYRMDKIHPFSIKLLYVIVIGLVSYAANFLIPPLSFPIADLILRSVVFTLIFGGLILSFKISPDLQNLISIILQKVRSVFPTG